MELKTAAQIETMAEGGRRLAAVLAQLRAAVHPGITTLALDRIAHDLIVKGGDMPNFLHYRPAGAKKAYPYTLCASVNNVVVHGQPSGYVLKDGDVVKLDLGLRHRGLNLDSAITVGVGSVTKLAGKLLSVTEESLYAGIGQAEVGKTLGDIGWAIERVIGKNKFSVVDGLTGHGIGRELHEEPTVFNFGERKTGMRLVEGLVIAIEPMVATGRGAIMQLPDESYGTVDGSLTAQFEHTVAITADGPRILTKIV
jgi:methionyl aminopeptidase